MGLKRTPTWAVRVLGLLLLFLAVFPHIESNSPVWVEAQADHIIPLLYKVEAQAAQSGWTAELHNWAGDLYREIGDLVAAAAHWEAAQVDDVPALERLAQTYLTLQRWDDTRNTLERLLVVDPDHAWGHYQLGLILMAYDPIAAETHLRVVVGNSAYNVVVAALLDVIQYEEMQTLAMRAGFVMANHNLWPYAELIFRQVALVNHPYPEAMAYVGLARTNQGKDGSAWMEQALLFGEDVARVYYLYGLHLRYLGDYRGSKQAFSQATVLDSVEPVYYAELGMANSYVLELEEAEYWLMLAVALSNYEPAFQELLAQFYTETGYTSGVMNAEFLSQLNTYVPDDADSLANYGWTWYLTGDVGEALLQLDAALGLEPQNPLALFYKAQILLASDLTEQAVPLLVRLAASESPSAEWAAEVLALLESEVSDSE
jgi:tetratricopeptide (TPR) repeat protein